MRITVVRGPKSDGSTWEESFELPELVGASVSNVLQYINRNIDGTLAYYLSCRRGLCAACVVRINGKNEMACVIPTTDGMVIEPTKVQLLIKDTVVHLGMPLDSELSLCEAVYRQQNPSENEE
jgi:succinate dehydrogenase/fumarate reductase-like Fe-S protein